MYCRGIRGATIVDTNTKEEILTRTRELLTLLIRENAIEVEQVASAIFTVTDDVNAEFPAIAARQLGWTEAALLCTREIPVPGSLPSVVRILIHYNTTKSANQIRHIYTRGAEALRKEFVYSVAEGDGK